MWIKDESDNRLYYSQPHEGITNIWLVGMGKDTVRVFLELHNGNSLEVNCFSDVNNVGEAKKWVEETEYIDID